MTDQWKQISGLYHAALKLPESERAAYLKEYASSEDVRLEVESLLAHERTGEQLLKSPALDVAAKMMANENPVLMTGRTLGHYKVANLLGKGGMGEVYRAKDQKLGRDVAIKILPEEFGGDAGRAARFQREAKLLASLNHPNIAAIHGLEQSGATQFLVLEYVEGETLQARLSKGALPLEDALVLCRQIAEGLEAAHEKGVIHRDLKPANVMITVDEKVKILDFGLAKALSDETQVIDSSNSPTITEAMSRPGVILGTAAYMSPEQAKGKPVDKRADIWAFGCILYECLTGKKAFEGETVTETIAAVITKDPEWDKAPIKVHAVLHRCLDKDPKKRLRDIGEATPWIENVPQSLLVSTRVKKTWLAWSVALLLLVSFAAFLLFHLRKTSVTTSELLMQFQIDPLPIPTAEGSFAISPDGRYLVYAAKGFDGIARLWIRPVDSMVDRPLYGTESNYIPPFFWSPDSRFIAFDCGGTLKKVDVSGSPPKTICDLPAYAVGGSWNSNDVIILGILGEGIMRVDAEGGAISHVTKPNKALGETEHIFPVFLPDGRTFLYFCSSKQSGKRGLYVGSLGLKPGEQDIKQIQISNFGPGYVPSRNSGLGWLLFMQERILMAQTFDEKHLELIGEPETIVQNVGSFMAFGYFSASTTGAFFYRGGQSSLNDQIKLFDRNGNVLGTVGKPGDYYGLAFSPNGEQAAMGFANFTGASASVDIWLHDFSRDIDTRFTFTQGTNRLPAWSSDGASVFFCSNRDGIYKQYQKAVGGITDEEMLHESDEDELTNSLSKDGRFLLYTSFSPKTKGDLWVLPLKDKNNPIPISTTKYNEFDGHFSSDMRWVAYVSDESGTEEVYIRPFLQDSEEKISYTEGKLQISREGGSGPRWKGDSSELYYLAADGEIMAVKINGDTASTPGMPESLFKAPPTSPRVFYTFTLINWDASSDGNRFLISTQPEEGASQPFNVVLNWASLLGK